MKRKALIATICVLIITISTFSAHAIKTTQKIENTSTTEENIISTKNETTFNFTKQVFMTGGAAHLFSRVRFHDGPFKKINRVSRCLSRIRIAPLIPIVILENVTFTINYKIALPIGSKFSYSTLFGGINESIVADINNITDLEDVENTLRKINDSGNIDVIWNRPHTFRIENFTGVFIYRRTKLLRFKPEFTLFKPARFTFVGICDNIEPVYKIL